MKRDEEAFEMVLLLVTNSKLREILLKYRDIFAEELRSVPESRGADDCEIEILDPQMSAIRKQWKLSEEQKAEVRKQVKHL